MKGDSLKGYCNFPPKRERGLYLCLPQEIKSRGESFNGIENGGTAKVTYEISCTTKYENESEGDVKRGLRDP